MPLPVKFICGFIYSQTSVYNKALSILQNKFGQVDFESKIIPFNFTDYYKKEMGKDLLRRFISFKNLKNPADSVKIKLFCIKLEKKFSRYVRTGLCACPSRTINIDPGYINEAKLVLTTTKDFHHRIYLNKGIFAEVTLSYNSDKKNFDDFSTTFPDYRTQKYKDIMLEIRNLYRKQLKR